MEQVRTFELQYRIEHRHADGTWAEMVEERPLDDGGDRDAGAARGMRRIFRCRSCNATVILEPDPEGDQPQ